MIFLIGQIRTGVLRNALRDKAGQNIVGNRFEVYSSRVNVIYTIQLTSGLLSDFLYTKAVSPSLG